MASSLTIFMGSSLPLKSQQHYINTPKMCWGRTRKSTNNSPEPANKPKPQPPVKRLTTGLPKINGENVCSTESQKMNIPAQISTTDVADKNVMDKPIDGRLLKDGLVFQQNFKVRSFDMGSDSKISTVALMNYLQETALNHIRSIRLLADGFGSTPQMSKRNLMWVICQLQMEVDCYSSWADVIQIDTWMYASGKNGLGCGWHVRDLRTGKTLTRPTSVCLIMDKNTRKVSKFIEEVREEIMPFARHCDPIINTNRSSKLLKLDMDKADHVRTGLILGWTDMDVNQHVSHIKYLNYVLESVPHSVVESHVLFAITLEFRKECNKGSVLQTFSRIISNNNEKIEFDHLLCLEGGQEIMRGRTTWKPKYADSSIEKLKL